MDRFLLAENPIKKPNSKEYDPLYIIHTIAPECIIEAICLNDVDEYERDILPSLKFDYTNTDGVKEDWRLIVRKQFDLHGQKDLFDLLPRAWRWFRSYMEWEDTNIDIQEEGKWN